MMQQYNIGEQNILMKENWLKCGREKQYSQVFYYKNQETADDTAV